MTTDTTASQQPMFLAATSFAAHVHALSDKGQRIRGATIVERGSVRA
jgi:hypothetical protein